MNRGNDVKLVKYHVKMIVRKSYVEKTKPMHRQFRLKKISRDFSEKFLGKVCKTFEDIPAAYC